MNDRHALTLIPPTRARCVSLAVVGALLVVLFSIQLATEHLARPVFLIIATAAAGLMVVTGVIGLAAPSTRGR